MAHDEHGPDVVTSLTAWSDGGAECVFADGTVIAFGGPQWDCFAVFRPPAPHNVVASSSAASSAASASGIPDKDVHFTAMALSRDAGKVAAALEVRNTLLPQPKLISGLLPGREPAQLWTDHCPIDSFLLRDIDDAEDGSDGTDAELTELGSVRVWCASHVSSLTLSANGDLVVVAWPAVVYDSDGSSTRFVRLSRPQRSNVSIDTSIDGTRTPTHSSNPHTATAPSVRATQYVMQTQYLHADDIDAAASGALENLPQRENTTQWSQLAAWAPALRIARRKRAETYGLDVPAECSERRGMESVVLPQTLPPLDRCSAVARFPSVEPHHVASILAARRYVHGAACHTCETHRPEVFVTARFELGAWALRTAARDPRVVRALIFEDSSVASVAPQTAVADALPTMFTCAHASRQAAPEAQPGVDEGDPVPVQRFVYAADHSIPVPSPAGALPGYDAPGTRRYLPELVAVMASLSQFNHGRARREDRIASDAAALARASGLTSLRANITPASSKQRAHGLNSSHQQLHQGMNASESSSRSTDAIVSCATQLDGLGVFTAYTNGVVRAVFDDRTIVTLTPDARNTEEGLTATIMDARAVKQTVRVVQCTPVHSMYTYVAHTTAFAQFAHLSEDQRTALATNAPASPVEMRSGTYAAQLGIASDDELHAKADALLIRTRHLLQSGAHRTEK